MAKNFFKSMIMHLCMLLMMCLCFTCTSCDSVESKAILSEQHYQDSIRAVKIIEDIVNPDFYSLESLDAYRNQQIEYEKEKSIFLSLPDNVYQNVSAVCMNKHQKVNVHLIAKEYMLYKNVYDNLPNKKKDSVVEYEDSNITKTLDSLIKLE